jgi:hypothetical protein
VEVVVVMMDDGRIRRDIHRQMMLLLLRLSFVVVVVDELVAEMWSHGIVAAAAVVIVVVVVVNDADGEQVVAHGEIFVTIPTACGTTADDERRRRVCRFVDAANQPSLDKKFKNKKQTFKIKLKFILYLRVVLFVGREMSSVPISHSILHVLKSK